MAFWTNCEKKEKKWQPVFFSFSCHVLYLFQDEIYHWKRFVIYKDSKFGQLKFCHKVKGLTVKEWIVYSYFNLNDPLACSDRTWWGTIFFFCYEIHCSPFTKQCLHVCEGRPLNFVGKQENDGNQHNTFVQNVFYFFKDNSSHFR